MADKAQLKIFIIMLMLVSAVAGFIVSLYFHSQKAQQAAPSIVEQQRTYHYPISFVAQLTDDPHAGEKIFHEFCASCHGKQPLIEVHAPRIGHKKEWEQRRHLNMDTLLLITRNGVGPMPARGGCFECSDEQLKQAIQYIFDNT